MSVRGSNQLSISEIFCSPQGEGQFAGTRSVFVRLNGCNLRCHFCDTPYASWEPQGVWWSVQDVFQEIRQHEQKHVVLTGGEPMLQPGIVLLTKMLREKSHYITIETAGTVWQDVSADLMSVSPKRANSTPVDHHYWAARHDRLRDNPEVIRKMIAQFDHQFKFVINEPSDLKDVALYAKQYPELQPASIWLMPQTITKEELFLKEQWLKPLAEKQGYQYSSRLHILEFGNRPGT